jgi:cobalt-zinc-cadmium efflux system outer membrane protein
MRTSYVVLASLFLLSFSARASNSITIEEAVAQGLKQNLDLMAAKYGVSLAEADELTAGLWNNPALLVDTVFQPFGSNWNQSNAGGPRQYDAILSYPLDLSGKRSAQSKSAHQATRIAETSFLDAVRQKILQIRLAYIDLTTLREQLTLANERDSYLSRLVQMIENRIGKRSLLPLLQRRAQLARDQALLDTRQKANAVKTAETSLLLLLGKDPFSSLDLSTKLRDFKLPRLPSRENLISLALDERPDLKGLRITLTKSDLDKDLAEAQKWDNFLITAGASRQGPNSANAGTPGSIDQPEAYSWTAGITIPLPLFNRNQGNVQKAVVTKAQTEKQMVSLEMSIKQEIDTDVRQLQLNKDLIEEYEKTQLKNARKVRDSQQTLFGTGGSGILDYFDAISAYQTTLSSYYDVVGEYRRSLFRLYSAVGKDFQL